MGTNKPLTAILALFNFNKGYHKFNRNQDNYSLVRGSVVSQSVHACLSTVRCKELPSMDPAKLEQLESILRFSGPKLPIVNDASVLNCGCLVSESAFIQNGRCPACSSPSTIVCAVEPLRNLYQVVKQFQLGSQPYKTLVLKSAIESQRPDTTDFVGLFYKFAKEELQKPKQTQSQTQKTQSHQQKHEKKPECIENVSVSPERTRILSKSAPASPQEYFTTPQVDQQSTEQTQKSGNQLPIVGSTRQKFLAGLSESEEYNFSRCFPFHRKHSSFPTQQNRFALKSRNFLNKSTKFCCTDIISRPDPSTGREVTTFALVSDKTWELFRLADGKPKLAACGKSTGEYGPLVGEMAYPDNHGVVIRNEFGGTTSSDKSNGDEAPNRLKSWVHLYCRLSERYLVISGTRGVVRVLNVDPELGPLGSPVYTYTTNFPIRCIAVAPNQNLIACGITALERISSKQQPFIILHSLEYDQEGKLLVRPVTITVPFRDPLKMINFNASSSHLIVCTVYEMRYFIIQLRQEHSFDYSRPRLIWNDTRLGKEVKIRGTNEMGKEDGDTHSNSSYAEDAMLDNEGITAIKFGLPCTNTVVITSSSFKNRPPVVLKFHGPSIDYELQNQRCEADNYDTSIQDNYEDLLKDVILDTAVPVRESGEKTTIEEVEMVMKVPEVGSSIYNVEVSPRGDGMVFVDKLGKLYLVASNMQMAQGILRTRVVLLGESADAYRHSETTSVRFAPDGGKIYVVDRRGLIQVFDFTKGIPGEDLDVIKCKIISV